jgi:CRP/FNR family transcriptional regulator, cyclic AMP receptor protein
MLFIVSGAVLVTLRHPVLDPYLGHLGIRGDWLGEFGALQGATRRTGMEAATPLVALCLTYPSTREMMASRPAVAQHFSSLLAWNYEIALRSGLDFTIADPLPRICARLLTLGGFGRNWPEDAGPVSLPITKEQLASMAAVSRNSVHRVLKVLEERGICGGEYGGITIHDAMALKQILQADLLRKSGEDRS